MGPPTYSLPSAPKSLIFLSYQRSIHGQPDGAEEAGRSTVGEGAAGRGRRRERVSCWLPAFPCSRPGPVKPALCC